MKSPVAVGIGVCTLLTCALAHAGTATYSSDSDSVQLTGTGLVYNGDTIDIDLAAGGGNIIFPGVGGGVMLTNISPGPFTYTILFDGTQTQNTGGGPNGGAIRMLWNVGGNLQTTDMMWESFGVVTGGGWTVTHRGDFPPTGDATDPILSLQGLRINFDGSTVLYEHTLDGSTWIPHHISVPAANLPSGNYEFGLFWGSGPSANPVSIDEITITGANIPDVNDGGGGGGSGLTITSKLPNTTIVALMPGQTAELGVTTNVGATFQWFKNGVPIPGQTASTLTVGPAGGPVGMAGSASAYAYAIGGPTWPGLGPPVLHFGPPLTNPANGVGAPDASFITGTTTFAFYQGRNAYVVGFSNQTGLTPSEIAALTEVTFRVTYSTTETSLHAVLELNRASSGNTTGTHSLQGIPSIDFEAFPVSAGASQTVDLVFPRAAMDVIGLEEWFSLPPVSPTGEIRGLIGFVDDLVGTAGADFDLQVDAIEVIADFDMSSGDAGVYSVVADDGMAKATVSTAWSVVVGNGVSVPVAGVAGLITLVAGLGLAGVIARRKTR